MYVLVRTQQQFSQNRETKARCNELFKENSEAGEAVNFSSLLTVRASDEHVLLHHVCDCTSKIDDGIPMNESLNSMTVYPGDHGGYVKDAFITWIPTGKTIVIRSSFLVAVLGLHYVSQYA